MDFADIFTAKLIRYWRYSRVYIVLVMLKSVLPGILALYTRTYAYILEFYEIKTVTFCWQSTLIRITSSFISNFEFVRHLLMLQFVSRMHFYSSQIVFHWLCEVCLHMDFIFLCCIFVVTSVFDVCHCR